MKKLLKLFWIFFKIGAFTFGGGYAMIPLIEREMVEKQKWLSDDEIIDMFAVAESIPGAIAINTSTFIGYKVAGYWGAIVAMFGVALPSFLIITIIALVFSQFQDLPLVKAAFEGIRAAVVALIAISGVKIARSAIKNKFGMIITLVAFILLVFADVHAIILIIFGAIAGLLMSRYAAKEGREDV